MLINSGKLSGSREFKDRTNRARSTLRNRITPTNEGKISFRLEASEKRGTEHATLRKPSLVK